VSCDFLVFCLGCELVVEIAMIFVWSDLEVD